MNPSRCAFSRIAPTVVVAISLTVSLILVDLSAVSEGAKRRSKDFQRLFNHRGVTSTSSANALVCYPPWNRLQVNYGGVAVTPGGLLRLAHTQRAPNVRIHWPHVKRRALYTLIMTDMDGVDEDNVSGPRFQFHHWVVVNIPGGGRVQDGHTLASYLPPAPPPQSGNHRYVLLTFRQPSGRRVHVSPDAKWSQMDGSDDNLGNRGKWSMREFRDAYGMERRPMAGNFFVARDGH